MFYSKHTMEIFSFTKLTIIWFLLFCQWQSMRANLNLTLLLIWGSALLWGEALVATQDKLQQQSTSCWMYFRALFYSFGDPISRDILRYDYEFLSSDLFWGLQLWLRVSSVVHFPSTWFALLQVRVVCRLLTLRCSLAELMGLLLFFCCIVYCTVSRYTATP